MPSFVKYYELIPTPYIRAKEEVEEDQEKGNSILENFLAKKRNVIKSQPND